MAMASFPISSATARAPSRLRSAMATFAPSFAIRMAVAFPSPEAPPVIRATLLDARPIVCFLLLSLPQDSRVAGRGATMMPRQGGQFGGRSEERRVGKEWVGKCRSRWSPDCSKKYEGQYVEIRGEYN